MVIKQENEQRGGSCPMDEILRIIMGPWTTYILWLLETEGELRFGELKSHMRKISSKVLTERLRMLEGAGLVHREYEPTVPPTVTYSLTKRGHELKSVLKGIHALALRWQDEDANADVRLAGE
ncbi:MAG: helix-turn-helix domain-containing protein [Anderseniella sp.]